MKRIKVRLTKEHLAKAPNYFSNRNCIMAVALKEMFPTKIITVGGATVTIGDNKFYIENNQRICGIYKMGNRSCRLPAIIHLEKR